tara:strand:+ start:898 stop:1008 length:111 start_codon:yes stop_codon:yes gene_type:complete
MKFTIRKMYEVDGMTRHQIALALNISEAEVKQALRY